MELVKEKSSRKQEIEEKATELFMDKGYAGSSMRDLAGVVGIEPASIYSHIRSKEEILHTICFRIANKFITKLNQVLNQNSSPRQKLKSAIHAHVSVIVEDLSASAVFWNEWKHLSEPAITEFSRMKADYEDHFIDLIRELLPDGSDLNPKITALTLLSSLNCMQQWYHPDGSMSHLEIANQIAELYIKGIEHQH